MSELWMNAYSDIKEYVQKNPAVEISRSVVVVPDEARPGFYQRFDNIRRGFVEQRFGGQLQKARQLGEAVAQAEAALLSGSALKSIHMDQLLRWFLTDPADGLSRRLFDVTFELVQEQITPEQYADRAGRLTAPLVPEYLRQGYVRWAGLNLMRMLSPSAYFVSDVEDQYTDPDLSQAYNRPGYEIGHPKLQASDKFSFSMNEYTSILPPNVIFFSDLLHCYVGLNVDFHRVYKWVREPSVNRKWIKLEGVINELGADEFWPDIAIYKSDAPEDLLISAEWKNLNVPEFCLTVSPDDSYDAGEIASRLGRFNHAWGPRLGNLAICRGKAAPPPVAEKVVSAAGEAASQETPVSPAAETETAAAPQISPEALGIIEADLDSTKLAKVIDILQG
jgi:hypothetical protein